MRRGEETLQRERDLTFQTEQARAQLQTQLETMAGRMDDMMEEVSRARVDKASAYERMEQAVAELDEALADKECSVEEQLAAEGVSHARSNVLCLCLLAVRAVMSLPAHPTCRWRRRSARS